LGILTPSNSINEIKIKLVICEVSKNTFQRGVRQFISPFMSKFETFPEFGMFHTGLMVGPWMLDWNDSGVCIPRKCVSQAALISADLGSFPIETKLDDLVDKLSTFVVEYNTTKIYKDRPCENSHEVNCQDFVFDLLERLGIKMQFTGPLAHFIGKLRSEGKCKISFDMDPQFRDRFDLKGKEIEFKSHLELDKFVKKFQEHTEYSHNDPVCKDAMILLKSFDRAFWLKALKFPENVDFSCLSHPGIDENGLFKNICECPFLDPCATGSFVIENKRM
jgi:hypothetical protein